MPLHKFQHIYHYLLLLQVIVTGKDISEMFLDNTKILLNDNVNSTIKWHVFMIKNG